MQWRWCALHRIFVSRLVSWFTFSSAKEILSLRESLPSTKFTEILAQCQYQLVTTRQSEPTFPSCTYHFGSYDFGLKIAQYDVVEGALYNAPGKIQRIKRLYYLN